MMCPRAVWTSHSHPGPLAQNVCYVIAFLLYGVCRLEVKLRTCWGLGKASGSACGVNFHAECPAVAPLRSRSLGRRKPTLGHVAEQDMSIGLSVASDLPRDLQSHLHRH
ncbi:hypothetical protein U0070_015698 [Myodes glareolus]|uniref:Uncharacterized protein n=1 Tax=Myodes glareolus TaxID=447135 RepID=A0AAW0HH33_MYOGA